MNSAPRQGTTLALSMGELVVRDGEPRVFDLRLAEVLGMPRPRDIRARVIANFDEISMYGGVCEQSSQTAKAGSAGQVEAKSKGGRPSVAYYLNEPQALLLCMWARTPTAAAVRKQLIEVFMAWRLAQQQPHPDTVSVRAHERRTSTRIDDAYRLARSVDRLEQLAERIQPSTPTLIYVNDEPVVVDVQDFALKPNTEAVVIHDDGSLAIDRVVMVDDHRGARSAMGEWAGNTRPGVIVMGRVLSRMVRRVASSVQPVVEHKRVPMAPVDRRGARPSYKDAILACIAQGMKAREIAEQTGASIHTVKDWMYSSKRRKRAA